MTWEGPVSAQVHFILLTAARALQGWWLPVGRGHWRSPLEGHSEPSLALWAPPAAQTGTSSPGGTGAAPSIGHLPGDGTRAHGWAQLSGADVRAGLREAGDCLAVDLLGRGLTAPGG